METSQRPGAVRVWWLAARPATLWAAFAPVLVGTACALAYQSLDLRAALAALAGAILIQVGTNFANDLFDFRKGADNRDRIGPKRAVQAGWLSEGQMWRATWFVFFLSALTGLYLAWIAGPVVIAIGLASILAGVLYTAGPFPFAYIGLGDVFVFLFFGFVAVCGTAFVQMGQVPSLALWASVPLGALSTAILVVNNVRDINTDRAAGKKTLAVRLGSRAARWQYSSLLAISFAVPIVLFRQSGVEWPILLPCLLLPMMVALTLSLFRQEGAALNPLLGDTAKLLLLYSVLLTLGIVFGATR